MEGHTVFQTVLALVATFRNTASQFTKEEREKARQEVRAALFGADRGAVVEELQKNLQNPTARVRQSAGRLSKSR